MNRLFICILLVLFTAAMPVWGQYVEVPASARSMEAKVDLSGEWLFSPGFQPGLSRRQAEVAGWKPIRVPGEWFMQGFRVEAGAEAGYLREFVVPANWKNQSVYLHCDAVFSRACVFVNGKAAGTHDGPMVAFDLDVTALIQPGKTNRIGLGVVSETLSDTLMSGTQYAAHPLGGILRKIYLVAVPKQHLADLTIDTRFDETYTNARLQLGASVRNQGKAGAAKVTVSLKDPAGNEVPLSGAVYQLDVAANSNTPLELDFNIPSPLKWDAEHPNLYGLQVKLESEAGTEMIEKHVGFRQIEVVGSQLFINGRPVKLKGVNRHEVHPLLGRSLTAEQWEQDARLFKAANVNYIRTSHYPPAPEFVDWCDKLGLYVELENPIAWIGHGANAHWKTHNPHDPALYPYLEEISTQNIAFFRNHPSVLMWSMANESAWGPNWDKLADLFASLDPSRPATFHDQAYGGFNNFGSTKMPVANIHYPGTAGPGVANEFVRPLLFGEYAHLNTYNRSEIVTDPGVRDAWGRGFRAMWEGMYHSRGCLGGAVWSGIDDVFYLPDGRMVGYGEWGPIDGWRREKPEYFHLMKTYSPVMVHTRSVAVPKPGQGIALQVENRFDFTNLSECTISWKLGSETGFATMNLAPHHFGKLVIQPQNTNIEGQLLEVKFVSPQGIEVETSVIEVGEVKRDALPFARVKPGTLTVSSDKAKLVIVGDGFGWQFDLENGKLLQAEVDGKQVLSVSPDLMVLSLTTGECLTEHDLHIPFHNDVCSNWSLRSTEWKQANDTVVVTVNGRYTEAEGELVYRFAGDGSLYVTYRMTALQEVNPRQWGLVFTTPRTVENLEWYRNGLWSWYPENHIGRTHGKAIPFGPKAFRQESVSQVPQNDWFMDANSLGTADFRSTRENIYWAALTAGDGKGIAVLSNGKQAFRSFVNGDAINFLVAGYSTGGGDLFFSSHYAKERAPLKTGSVFSGSVTLQLVIGVIPNN